MRGKKRTLTNHEASKGTQETSDRVGRTKQGEPMYEKFKQRIRLHNEQPSPTLVSGGIRPQFQHGHPLDARGLTVRERARLMSFPDDFVFEGGTVMGRVQTGQAVPPLLAKVVAEQTLAIPPAPGPEFTIIHDNTIGTARNFQNTHTRLEGAEIITFTDGLERWPPPRRCPTIRLTSSSFVVQTVNHTLSWKTTDLFSDKAFQRFARMRGAAENGLIGLHAQRLLKVGTNLLSKPQTPQAFRVLEEQHPGSSVSFVVYPLNAGLTPIDRSDANQWQTDEGDQDTMWQRIGSVVGILMDGLDAGLSMPQINQNVRTSSTRALFDADFETWVAHVQRSRSEGGLGYSRYRNEYAAHPPAFSTWTRAEASAAGVPAAIIGDSTHVHRYHLSTDAYMRPSCIAGDPYAGHSYGLRTLYVERDQNQNPFVLHMSNVDCSRWDEYATNPEMKGVRMLRHSVGACCCPTASERFHQHLRVSGTKSFARILPRGPREHQACRRLKNRHQHKRLSGSHRSR